MTDHAAGHAFSARDQARAAERLIDGLASAALHARLEMRSSHQNLPAIVGVFQPVGAHYDISGGKTPLDRAESSLRVIQSSLNTTFSISPSSRSSPISNWPARVLTSIARHLDLDERISLANSCRSVQVALHSEPSLWNRVGILEMSFAHDRNIWLRARRILGRAARAESRHLMVNMHPYTNSTSGQWPALSEFLQRGTGLRLMILDAHHAQPLDTARRLRDVFCDTSAAPHLERLSLGLSTHHSDNSWVLPSDFLCGNLGRLKSCRLQQVSLMHEFPYPAFANLREFSYVGMHSSDQRDLNFVRNIICCIPKLEVLGLSQVSFTRGDIPADPAPIQAPNLRFVCAESIFHGVVELAQLLIAVPVAQYFGSPADARNLFDVWPNEDIALAINMGQVHIQGSSRRHLPGDNLSTSSRKQSFQFSTWSTATWTVHNGYEPQLALTDTHAHRVTSLSIHERQWETTFDTLPHLPCLAVLSIVLSTCAEERQADGDRSGIFWSDMISAQSSDGAGSKMRLLALKELNIHSGTPLWLPFDERPCCFSGLVTQPFCTCATGCTIALCDVADFIRRMPLTPALRLKRVNLHGMAAIVDFDPGKALCDLLSIVQEVECTSEAMPTIMRTNHGSRFDEALAESSDRELYKGSFLSPSNIPARMFPPAEMFWDMY